MRRLAIAPRPNWQQRVAAEGLTFHSDRGEPYWDESACWEFSPEEIDRLESATAELESLCVAAGDHALRHGWLERMHIPAAAADAIRYAWTGEPPSLYGRMDLAYNGDSIKLLEYNADTPTSLLEAAVVQWRWIQEVSPGADQWNSLHERLVARWRALQPRLAEPVYFSHDGGDEDELTIAYLRETARQAGLATVGIAMRDIGWNHRTQSFVDLEQNSIGSIFKLYPWEAMLRERFSACALESMSLRSHPEPGRTQWIEPVSKMLWSNKALLALLWELFPGHDLLLPAYLDSPRGMQHYARKPFFGREGANILLVDGSSRTETNGRYAGDPVVYQALAPVRCTDGNWVILGSWLVGGEPAGMGIREGRGPILRNTDRFVPHRILP